MPFCPNCKAEYVVGITRCYDCDVPLVDELPHVVYEECDDCSGDVTPDSDFCPHCGILRLKEDVHCSVHPERRAVRACIICHRLLCKECLRKKRGRAFCAEHEAVEVSEDWAVAFQSEDYYEANIVRGKLESAGITVNPRNNTSIGFIADGFIESAIGRTILKYPVKVFVPLYQYLQAVEIVKEESETDT